MTILYSILRKLRAAAPPPPLAVAPGPLSIAPGELWCRACGSSGGIVDTGSVRDGHARSQHCTFCGSHNLVPADSVLRHHEYILIGPP